MALSFPCLPENNPALRGQLATKKQFFGDNSRYAVAAVHTRFDEVEVFVWDAESPSDAGKVATGTNFGGAAVIRQEATFEAAIAGLGA